MVVNEDAYERMKAAFRNGNSEDAAKELGGWATKDTVDNVQDVRDKLAISSEWKGQDGQKMYVIEFSVKPGVGLREGTVWSMYDAKLDAVLPGGGHQVQFMQNGPWATPDNYQINIGKTRELP
jgi:hypothetical protein